MYYNWKQCINYMSDKSYEEQKDILETKAENCFENNRIENDINEELLNE